MIFQFCVAYFHWAGRCCIIRRARRTIRDVVNTSRTNIDSPAPFYRSQRLLHLPSEQSQATVRVNNQCYLIVDAIVFHIVADEYRIVGVPAQLVWIHFYTETRGDDITIERDHNSDIRQEDPEYYRVVVLQTLGFGSVWPS